jgi:hypothetical protein
VSVDTSNNNINLRSKRPAISSLTWCETFKAPLAGKLNFKTSNFKSLFTGYSSFNSFFEPGGASKLHLVPYQRAIFATAWSFLNILWLEWANHAMLELCQATDKGLGTYSCSYFFFGL